MADQQKNGKTESPAPTLRKPRDDGLKSRRAILDAAARLATTRGLEELSIGELAQHIGMSKSGLYAHFKSKEELELANIDTAAEIFEKEAALWVPTGCMGNEIAVKIHTKPGQEIVPRSDMVAAVSPDSSKISRRMPVATSSSGSSRPPSPL